ncbi:MAG: hypothetical protein JJ979_02790 [Roseibium sp.]|nr:hypothetical protein [Roseibium sp.]
MLRFTFLVLAAWLFFATSGQAFALPIAGAIVGLIGLGGTALGGILTSVIGIGLTVGVSIGLSSLFSPDQAAISSTGANSGVRADVTFGAKQHHDFAFGLVAIGGHYAYYNTSGSNNQRLDQVYVLSTGWCESLEKLYVNGEDCDLTEVDSGTGWTKYAVTLPDDGGTRRLWVSRWTSSHIGAGICYAHIEADYAADVEAFRSILGGNAFLFVFKGLRLYDIRKDSTAGGSGTHRFDDPTTWEWSAVPAVCKYHYERGYYINGSLAGGMGVASYDLLSDLYMAAANVCDEEVPLDGGGTEKRYELSLIVSTGAEHIDAIDSMVSAMAGMRVERQGMFGVVAGAAQVPVTTFTDDDLIADAPVSFTAKRPREDLFNEIYGQYTNPENLWDGSDIVPVIGDSGVKALDGGETRPVTKDLYQVTSGTRSQRLLRIAYRFNRHQRSAQVTLGEEAIAYEVGDWITWNSARYGNVTYLISGHVHDVENDVVTLSLEEVSNQIFAWGTGDESPLVLPPTPPATGPRPSNVNGLTLQAATISGADDQKLPAIAVSWVAVEDETIRSVVLEHKIKGEADSTAQRTEHTRPASGDWTGTLLASGILAGTDYEVRSSITTFPPRAVTWSGWAEIETSGEYRVPSAGSIYDEQAGQIPAAQLLQDLTAATDMAREVRDSLLPGASALGAGNNISSLLRVAGESQLKAALAAEKDRSRILAVSAEVRRVETVIEQQGLAFAEQITVVTARVDDNAAQIVQVDQARADGDSALAASITALTATVNNNAAAIVTEQTARADGDAALASDITALTATVADNAADIITEQTARADADSALSQSLTSVSSTVNGHTSSITTLQSSVDGIHAQYVLAVQAGGATGGFVVRGIERADGTGEIAFGIRSNLFYIVDTNDFDQAEAPFIFSGGKLYVREAVIPTLSADKITAGTLSAISASLGTVTAGKLQRSDGTMIVDLDNKRILIQ